MNHSIRKLLLGGVAALATFPVLAGDVTPERLVNADKEPHNWLMNHRDLRRAALLAARQDQQGERQETSSSPSRWRSAAPSANENLQATPLVEDGFMYITDQLGRGLQDRRALGRRGPHRVEDGSRPAEAADRNRGVALWGNLVDLRRQRSGRVIATDKDTGKIVWETNLRDQPDVQITAAPLALKDKIIVGASGGDHGVRDWIAALDAKTGKLIWRKYAIPAPGEPGSETWKDKNNAWQTGGGAFWVTGSYDPATNQVIWGTGNPVPMFDPTYRPGDNLYTNSAISCDPDTGKMNWYFQYTPNDKWDYDETGTHILIDGKVDGEDRKMVTHAGAQRLQLHLRSQQRPVPQGQALRREGHLDQGHRSEDRQAARLRSRQGHPDLRRPDEPDAGPTRPRSCARPCRAATISGRRPTARRPSSSTSRRLDGCDDVTLDPSRHMQGGRFGGGNFTHDRALRDRPRRASIRFTGEVKKKVRMPYPNAAACSRPPAASS